MCIYNNENIYFNALEARRAAKLTMRRAETRILTNAIRRIIIFKEMLAHQNNNRIVHYTI